MHYSVTCSGYCSVYRILMCINTSVARPRGIHAIGGVSPLIALPAVWLCRDCLRMDRCLTVLVNREENLSRLGWVLDRSSRVCSHTHTHTRTHTHTHTHTHAHAHAHALTLYHFDLHRLGGRFARNVCRVSSYGGTWSLHMLTDTLELGTSVDTLHVELKQPRQFLHISNP